MDERMKSGHDLQDTLKMTQVRAGTHWNSIPIYINTLAGLIFVTVKLVWKRKALVLQRKYYG